MCDLYDDLETKSEPEVRALHQKQISGAEPIDVVIMSKCTDHCFHKDCLRNQMKEADSIRCAVCNQIYGVLTGQMPPGRMDWNLEKQKGVLHGYPKE